MTRRWRPAAAALLCGLVQALAQAAEGPESAPSVNAFLANVPLDTLDATRSRPLFLPSRRAPQAVASPASPSATPVQPRTDEPPRLTLLGIIRAPDSGGSAVVMDETDRTSVSLKPGDSRRGWVVRSIGDRTVTLAKQDRTVSLSFLKGPPAGRLPAE